MLFKESVRKTPKEENSPICKVSTGWCGYECQKWLEWKDYSSVKQAGLGKTSGGAHDRFFMY